MTAGILTNDRDDAKGKGDNDVDGDEGEGRKGEEMGSS